MIKKLKYISLLFLILIFTTYQNKELPLIDQKECDKKFQSCINKCTVEIPETRYARQRGMCKDECAHKLNTEFGCIIYYKSSYK
jgi:hypothetical protein